MEAEKPVEVKGFTHIYVGHANRVVADLANRGRLDKVSRAKIEMQILKSLDTATFPMTYRIAWFSLVLHTNKFDVFWLGQQELYNLSNKSIRRLKPDLSLADLPPLEELASSGEENLDFGESNGSTDDGYGYEVINVHTLESPLSTTVLSPGEDVMNQEPIERTTAGARKPRPKPLELAPMENGTHDAAEHGYTETYESAPFPSATSDASSFAPSVDPFHLDDCDSAPPTPPTSSPRSGASKKPKAARVTKSRSKASPKRPVHLDGAGEVKGVAVKKPRVRANAAKKGAGKKAAAAKKSSTTPPPGVPIYGRGKVV